MADAVPVSELEKLRDYLYAEDLIFMRGLAKINKLIAKYGGKMDEGQIDAVPVVRCKDCAVPHNKYTGCPELNGLIPPPNFYCAAGEIKRGAHGLE